MGGKYQAQQRVEHVAIACEPDMIKPDPKSPPLPFVTYSEFDTAVNVAGNTAGNQHPSFVSVSKVPTCKGGPPGGQGIKSGTWNGEFVPKEWSDKVSAGPGWQVYHGHKGTINKGNAEAQVYTAVAAGAPSSPCIAALQVQFQRVKKKAVAEATTSPGQFGKDMASGAWENIKGYGDAAVGVWDKLKSFGSAVWNDPGGMAQKALAALGDAGKAAVKGLQQVGGLAKAVASSELTVDDLMDGLQDIVSEIGEEAACALAKMLKELADAPGGVGEAVGALTFEVAVQVGLAFVSGGAGNAAAASAKAAKGGKYAEAGLDVIGKSGDKLRAMGLSEGDDITSFMKKLNERRRARRGQKPDESANTPAERNPEQKKAANAEDAHLKGEADGKAKDPCPKCATTANPVNPVQGCKVLSGDDDMDFVLPGLVPLSWQRTYASNNPGVAWFGQGWSVPFTLSLRLKNGGETIAYIDDFGREVPFPGLAPGREFFSPSEGIALRRDVAGGYAIVGGSGGRMEFGQASGDYLLCTALLDVQGLGHRVYYGKDVAPGERPLPRYLLAQGGQVLALRFARSGRHQGVVAQRLVEVMWVGDASTGQANPLHRHLDASSTFEQRCDQLHQLLLADRLGLSPGSGTRCLVQYSYDDDANLVAVSLPDEGRGAALTVRRRYGWQDHLMVMHDGGGEDGEAGWVRHYRYDRNDVQGRVVHHWQTIDEPGRGAVTREWLFDYASDHTRITEAPGTPMERVTLHHFRSDRRLTGITDPLGGRTTFELNQDGLVTAIVDPAGSRIEYLLDRRGRPMAVVNANGERTSMVWHAAFDQPLQIVDPLGGGVRFETDSMGRVVAQTDALGRRTEYRLDRRGLPFEVRDAKGGVTRLAHDDHGQLTLHTDCSGRSTALEYDEFGHLSLSRNALGETTHYRHDRAGRLLELRHPDGSEERFGYDAHGRLASFTNAAGAVTRWTLAADGLPVARSDALGHALQYEYDVHRRLVRLTNENGDPYGFEHDALDRLVQQTGFDRTQSRYLYDAAGMLVQQLELGDDSGAEADRIESRFERDAVGRLLAKHVKAADRPLLSTRFAYDARGALLQATNAQSRVTLGYDLGGQLIEETVTAGGQGPEGQRNTMSGGGREHRLRHQYDELGTRIATILPDGRVLNSLVYGSGHVHQINLDGQLVSDFERDALHREVARSQGQLTTTQRYDPMGRLLEQRVQRLGVQTAVSVLGGVTGGAAPASAAGLRDGAAIFRRYRYDTAGRLRQADDWQQRLDYAYDPLGQLLSVNGERFAFDPAHNLLPDTPGAGRVERNRLLVFGDQRFSYDPHGRMVHKLHGRHSELTLRWDGQHQLERSELRASGQPSVVTGYNYDPFGRRLCKAPLDAKGRMIADRAVWFVWDGDRLLQELRAEPAGPVRTYVYEPDSFVPLAQLLTDAPVADASNDASTNAPGPARLIIPRPGRATPARRPGEPARIRYYHCDQIGTPRELTYADGTIAWRATYAAWGKTATVEWEGHSDSEDGAARCERDRGPASLQPLRSQGQFFDPETGLHYNRFRYYDPSCGRFASHDPVGLAGGTNTFASVSNPTAWADPLGLTPRCRYDPNMSELEKGAHSIHGEVLKPGFSPRTFNNTTIATAELQGADGQIHRVAASSQGRLTPAQTAKALALGYEPIRLPNTAGPTGHAERNIIKYAEENGLKVKDVAASRPICCNCHDAIQQNGANPVSPIKKNRIRR